VTATTELAAARLRAALGHFATGVTVVTAAGGDTHHGTTANAVSSVSLDPPLLLVCLRDESLTLSAMRESGRFAVNVLHADQEHLARRFARRGAGWDRVAHRDGLLDGDYGGLA
jgi:flavin reductase (DIM6/NTAB) family NADH-FMN oxidoreductase RutF